MGFAEVTTASIVGSAGYEYMRERMSVKAVIIIAIGALLLYLLLAGDDKLGKFGRAITA